jgi:hypothetical protein
MSVNAGRNYGHVIGSARLTQEEQDLNRNSDIQEELDIDCDCDYCNPKPKELTDGEKLQLVIDKQMADIMIGCDIKSNIQRQQQMQDRSDMLQRHFNSDDN